MRVWDDVEVNSASTFAVRVSPERCVRLGNPRGRIPQSIDFSSNPYPAHLPHNHPYRVEQLSTASLKQFKPLQLMVLTLALSHPQSSSRSSSAKLLFSRSFIRYPLYLVSIIYNSVTQLNKNIAGKNEIVRNWGKKHILSILQWYLLYLLQTFLALDG